MADPIDANVVLRYLTEDPENAPAALAGVLPFFEKLERGERIALLTPLELFQSYFVLTSYYGVDRATAAEKLRTLLAFRGLRVPEKAVLRTCLDTLTRRSADLVDAYLAALCSEAAAQRRLLVRPRAPAAGSRAPADRVSAAPAADPGCRRRGLRRKA